MQIPPANSGSWINPTAFSQQAAAEARSANTTHGHRTGVDPLVALEQTGKAGDRDADERYDGPSDQSPSSENEAADSTNSDDPSILNLPAIDDQPQSTLDLLG